MQTQDAFTHTEPGLLRILDELRSYEPIFHTHTFGLTTADCERRIASDYWEVGASGRRYSREFILQHFAGKPPIDAHTAGWKTSEHALRKLSLDTFLLTYTLDQGDRLTRRATIWRSTPQGWVILFHQGTIVSTGEDDAAPADS
jgi:hypothetical protein